MCVSERERQRKETAIDDKKGACLCFSGTGALKECEYLRVSKTKERVRTFAIVFKQDIRVLTFHVILMWASDFKEGLKSVFLYILDCRQLLPILNLFKNANVNTGDGIVYTQVS